MRRGVLIVLVAVVSALLVACGQSAGDGSSQEAGKTVKELAIRPSDVGQGAKPLAEQPEPTALTECGIQQHLLKGSSAYARSLKMEVGSSSFSSLVGLFPNEASAADAYRALTKKSLDQCYVTLVRHRIELKATPIGQSKLVTHKLSSPEHGTEYEVTTLAASLLGELDVFARVVLVQDGSSVYLTTSNVLGERDGFNLLRTTATAARHRYQAVFGTSS